YLSFSQEFTNANLWPSHPYNPGGGAILRGDLPEPVVRSSPAMSHLSQRITVDPEQCGGRPRNPGLRRPVTDALDPLPSGLAPQQVREDLPDLEPEDVAACLRFASRRLDHPTLAA